MKIPDHDYDLSLPNRMLSAAGWRPEDCVVEVGDTFILITHLPTKQVREWNKSRDKHPDRDLAVAP